MNLVYRNYELGDDHQIADLFNLAFHVVIPKTYEGWTWKFIEKPSFNPKALQICEDVDEKKIVGFIASEVDDFYLNGKIIKCGRINDVATDPNYQRNGIAKTLMKMAMDYFKEQKTQYAFLSANPRDHPRKMLYMPNGFKDTINMRIGIKILNYHKLAFKEAKILIPFLPLLYIIKACNSLRTLIKTPNKTTKNIIRENFSTYNLTNKNKEGLYKLLDLQQYFTTYNEAASSYQLFAEYRSKEDWYWRRINVPFEDFLPSFVILKNKKSEVIAGAAFSLHTSDIAVLKTKIRTKIAIMHEYFVDFDKIKDFSAQLSISEKKILDVFTTTIFKGALKRKASVIFKLIDKHNKIIFKSLKSNGCITIHAGVWMVKAYNRDDKVKVSEGNSLPYFMPTYDSIGFP